MGTKHLSIKRLLIFSIILVEPILGASQDWVRVFGHNSQGARGLTLAEMYDHGYLLGGTIKTFPNKQQGWLVKTDVNGQQLWDIRIGSGIAYTLLSGIATTPDFGVICTGYCTDLDPAADPFILKLNSCGEKEWCKIYSTIDNVDYGIITYPLPWGEGYISLFSLYKNSYATRIWLLRLDNNGNTIWENYYRQDTNYIWEYPCNLLLTSDSGFLITAYNYTEVDPGSGLYWYSPFWIKVDNNGNEVFESTWHQNGFVTGGVYETIEINNGNYLSAGSLDINPPNAHPSLYKISPEGDPIFRVDYIPDAINGNVRSINSLTPPFIVMGGQYALSEDSLSTMLLKCDTNGLLFIQKDIYLSGGPPTDIIFTTDQKILVSGSRITNIPPPPHLEACLFKFNQDLEYDTLDPTPRVYDSLCDHPIVSGTIPLDCEVVGLEEPFNDPEVGRLKVFPNPASEALHIQIPEQLKTGSSNPAFNVTTVYHQWHLAILEIYNIFGDRVYMKEIKLGDKQIDLDVTGWRSGMYLIRLVFNHQTVSTVKVLVE